jgi:hypothetical protein
MPNRRKLIVMLATGGAGLLAPPRQASAKPRMPSRDGYAIGGYDCVAYQTEKKAVKGQSSFSFAWNDATFQFKSQQDRDAFAANPTRYAPAFNG